METRNRARRVHVPGLKTFFSRQWWWTTLLVLVAIGVLARLGVWQLDRLEQRRAHNAQIVEQLALPPLFLDDNSLPADPADLKNRQATVHGEYDLSRQIALTQQNWTSRPGFHLITPLIIDGGNGSGDQRPRAVLVDRGWLPAAEQSVEKWSQYDLTGPTSVTGYVKLSQTVENSEPESGSRSGSKLQREWYRVDIAAIEAQMPYELLSVYLQVVPTDDGNSNLPYRSELDADLSEGNHFSYAIQWFIFAAILTVGYVHYVGRRENGHRDASAAQVA